MPSSPSNKSDKELALWLLDKMQNSEAFLATVRAARVKGRREALDQPEIVGKHKRRLKRLFQSDDEGSVDVSSGTAGVIDALETRDALSSPEQVLEKALEAYLEKHPDIAKDMPQEWQTTISLARAEVQGQISGAFHAGFTAELAGAAREEMAREAAAARGMTSERSGRES